MPLPLIPIFMVVSNLLFGTQVLNEFTGGSISKWVKTKLGIEFKDDEEELLNREVELTGKKAKLQADVDVLNLKMQDSMTRGLMGRIDQRWADEFGLSKEVQEFNEMFSMKELGLQEKKIDTQAELTREEMGLNRELGMGALSNERELGRLNALSQMQGPNIYAQPMHLSDYNPEFPLMSSLLVGGQGGGSSPFQG
jgi:hypothetical protein